MTLVHPGEINPWCQRRPTLGLLASRRGEGGGRGPHSRLRQMAHLSRDGLYVSTGFVFFFFNRTFSLFLFSILFIRISPSLLTALFFAARAPSFQEAILEVTFHCSSSLTSNRGPWKPLLLFLPCHSQASVGLSYSLFALKSQRPFPK